MPARRRIQAAGRPCRATERLGACRGTLAGSGPGKSGTRGFLQFPISRLAGR